MADRLAAPSAVGEEEDLELARQAAPSFLKLTEAVLHEVPDHLGLAEVVSSGFAQYSYAFVASEAERLQARDARAAQLLSQRAARLYRRAQAHAMAALELRWPGLTRSLAQPGASEQPLPDEAVGLAYWAAAAWGGWISLSKDRPEVVADLPLAMTLARRAWMRQPGHGDGALAALLGSFEAGRPGGRPEAAQAYFDGALAASQGRNPAVLVAMAEALAQPAGDRQRFETLLRQAVALAEPRRDPGAQVAAQRARWLLQGADDLF